MKSIPIVILLITLYLAGCSSREESTVPEKLTEAESIDSLNALQDEPNRKGNRFPVDSLDFETAFQQFFTALQSGDTTMLDHFIHPELGVWIIEQPGAVPKMTWVKDIRSFKRHYKARSFFTIAQEVTVCNLLEEPFPGFDCADMDKNDTGYSKDGCFVWKPEAFKNSEYWNYASLTETQVDQILATLPLIDKSVLHTASSFEFHFGYVNQQWRLLFAKLIHPCSV